MRTDTDRQQKDIGSERGPHWMADFPHPSIHPSIELMRRRPATVSLHPGTEILLLTSLLPTTPITHPPCASNIREQASVRRHHIAVVFVLVLGSGFFFFDIVVLLHSARPGPWALIAWDIRMVMVMMNVVGTAVRESPAQHPQGFCPPGLSA